jgi:hypothetical protein
MESMYVMMKDDHCILVSTINIYMRYAQGDDVDRTEVGLRRIVGQRWAALGISLAAYTAQMFNATGWLRNPFLDDLHDAQLEQLSNSEDLEAENAALTLRLERVTNRQRKADDLLRYIDQEIKSTQAVRGRCTCKNGSRLWLLMPCSQGHDECSAIRGSRP